MGNQRAHLLHVVLLISLFRGGCGVSLTPDRSLWAQVIDLDGEAVRYQLSGLQEGTSYEVRVSWPATIPSIIVLDLEVADQKAARLRRNARKLLDTEKVVFRADSAKVYSVRMQARRRSRHRDGPDGGTRQLMYNIVLEPLHFGLPRSTWPVALMCVGAVAGVVLMVPWWMRTVVPWALALILGGSARDTSSNSAALRRKRRK